MKMELVQQQLKEWGEIMITTSGGCHLRASPGRHDLRLREPADQARHAPSALRDRRRLGRVRHQALRAQARL